MGLLNRIKNFTRRKKKEEKFEHRVEENLQNEIQDETSERKLIVDINGLSLKKAGLTQVVHREERLRNSLFQKKRKVQGQLRVLTGKLQQLPTKVIMGAARKSGSKTLRSNTDFEQIDKELKAQINLIENQTKQILSIDNTERAHVVQERKIIRDQLVICKKLTEILNKENNELADTSKQIRKDKKLEQEELRDEEESLKQIA